jgi:hypothetical protein
VTVSIDPWSRSKVIDLRILGPGDVGHPQHPALCGIVARYPEARAFGGWTAQGEQTDEDSRPEQACFHGTADLARSGLMSNPGNCRCSQGHAFAESTDYPARRASSPQARQPEGLELVSPGATALGTPPRPNRLRPERAKLPCLTRVAYDERYVWD